MAMLLLESFPRNRSRAVHAALKVLEVMLLSAGLFFTLIVLKSSDFVPKSCDLVLSSLVGFWNSVKCCLSSPLHVCVIILFTLLLIRLSSTSSLDSEWSDRDDDHEWSNRDDDHVFRASIESIIQPPPISSPPPPPQPLPSAPPLPSPHSPQSASPQPPPFASLLPPQPLPSTRPQEATSLPPPQPEVLPSAPPQPPPSASPLPPQPLPSTRPQPTTSSAPPQPQVLPLASPQPPPSASPLPPQPLPSARRQQPPTSSLSPQPQALPTEPPQPPPLASPLPPQPLPSGPPKQPSTLSPPPLPQSFLLAPPQRHPSAPSLPPVPQQPRKERVVQATPRKGGTRITTTRQVDSHDPKDLHVIIGQGYDEKSNLSSPLASLHRQKPMPQVLEKKEIKPPPSPRSSLQESMNANMKIKSSPRSKKKPDEGVEDTINDYPHYEEDEEEDSLEATWRAITGGGKQTRKKQPLKKSETWDVPPSPLKSPLHRLDSELVVPSSPKWREMRDAETFNDAVSMRRRGGLVRKGSSLSLEDFNKQIEDFINKFKRKGASTSEGTKPSKWSWR